MGGGGREVMRGGAPFLDQQTDQISYCNQYNVQCAISAMCNVQLYKCSAPTRKLVTSGFAQYQSVKKYSVQNCNLKLGIAYLQVFKE